MRKKILPDEKELRNERSRLEREMESVRRCGRFGGQVEAAECSYLGFGGGS